MSQNKHIIAHERVIAFIAAGKARFTIVGAENRFTYYVMAPKFNGELSETMRFVKVMDSRRSNDMTYIGLLKLNPKTKLWEYEFRYPNTILEIMKNDSSFVPTLSVLSTEVTAFNYVVRRAQAGTLPTALEVWHEGKCACCGRPLTVPEAIQIGWGYKCLQKLKAKEAAMNETQEQFEAR